MEYKSFETEISHAPHSLYKNNYAYLTTISRLIEHVFLTKFSYDDIMTLMPSKYLSHPILLTLTYVWNMGFQV